MDGVTVRVIYWFVQRKALPRMRINAIEQRYLLNKQLSDHSLVDSVEQQATHKDY